LRDKLITILIVTLIAVLAFASPIYAASSTFLTEATKYFNKECKSSARGDEAAICFIFEKSKEIETAIASLNTKVTTIEGKTNSNTSDITELESINASHASQITTLQNKVTALENSQGPNPVDFAFFTNKEIALFANAESEAFDALGYSKVVFTFQCNIQGSELILFVSNDNINGVRAYTATADQCAQGGSITLDIAGRYYRAYIGNNTNVQTPRPSVTAIGHFQ
jgi:hypothetical protein